MTQRYDALMGRLRRGGRVLLDGGTGTELERRGVPTVADAWSGGGAMTHPAIVRDVHAAYIAAGAEIIISNTFGTSRHALTDAGHADHFEVLNHRGVALAVEAREAKAADHVLVAGGITHWSWTGRHPPIEELHDSVAAQAGIMAHAGADLLMLEMMVDIERSVTVLDAARTSGLPVWVGFSCADTSDGAVRLLGGPPLAEGLQAATERDVPLVSIMHTDVADIDACLGVVEEAWSGPVGVYAHSGAFVDNNWVFDGVISPEAYAAAAAGWLARGVQVVGGCCGTGPEHIRAASQAH